MANDKDFIVKNAVEVGGSVKTTVGTVTSGSVGYYLAGASYANKSFSVASEDNIPTGLVFNTDGTKLYVGGTQNETIYQYTLSTAFDVSTASYDSVSFSVSGQESNLQGFIFSADGAKLFVVGGGSATVYQYSLSTSFDLSTASYNSISFSVSGQDTQPYDVIFNSNGTKMYVAGNNTDTIYQYSLSSGFNLSTASYNSISFSVSGQDATPVGIRYNDNGTKLFMLGATNDSIYQYSLSTAFDLSTASYDSVSFSVASQGTAPQGVTLSADGTKMYVVDAIGDAVYQYSTALLTQTLDLSTGNYFKDTLAANTTYTLSNAGDVQSFQLEVTGGAILTDTWNISTAVFSNQNFSFSSQASSMRTGFFKPDGTKMYMGSISTNSIYEYDLSTAWDVSTVSYASKSFSISSQETAVSGLFFKTDGTKMYLCGKTGDDVNEYNLGTAWDVSTASYNQNFSVSGQEANPSGLFFRADGLKMYVAGATGDDVNEYTLSTAWDISSASYVQNFSFSSRDTDVGGIFFKEDGLKMFHLGDQNNKAYEYSLSTAWDVSTASFVQDFDVSSQEIYPKALSFKANGSKMFVFGEQGNDVSEYTVGSSSDATITYPSSIEFAGGVAPAAPATGETDIFTFSTDDGGTSYIGTKTADNLS